MKNGDMPIKPIFNDAGICTSPIHLNSNDPIGLTKREHFAAMAMQGILANQRLQMDKTAEGVAICAINHADALLSALDNE